MNFNYKKYLKSLNWLLKKTELVNLYIKNNWDIKCHCCKTTNNLIVHHFSYDNIGNEILDNDEESLCEIGFMCWDCHNKWHKENGFSDEIDEDDLKIFNVVLEECKNKKIFE